MTATLAVAFGVLVLVAAFALIWRVFEAARRGRGPLAARYAALLEEARARAAGPAVEWVPLAEVLGWRVVPGHEPRDPVVWLGGVLPGGLTGSVELALRSEPPELWQALATSAAAARAHLHVSVDEDDTYGGPAVRVRVSLDGGLPGRVDVRAPRGLGGTRPQVTGDPPPWLDDEAVQDALMEACRNPTFGWRDAAAWLTVYPLERARFAPVDAQVEVTVLATLLRAAKAASS